MAHCGYEPTAAHASLSNPLSALWTALRGVRTAGPMAPEISLNQQRPAQFVFSRHVDKMLNEIHAAKSEADPSGAKHAQPEMTAAAE
jgi:hypothetical protein